jgi:hypothetical protein
VKFEKVGHAQQAIKALNGYKMKGIRIDARPYEKKKTTKPNINDRNDFKFDEFNVESTTTSSISHDFDAHQGMNPNNLYQSYHSTVYQSEYQPYQLPDHFSKNNLKADHYTIVLAELRMLATIQSLYATTHIHNERLHCINSWFLDTFKSFLAQEQCFDNRASIARISNALEQYGEIHCNSIVTDIQTTMSFKPNPITMLNIPTGPSTPLYGNQTKSTKILSKLTESPIDEHRAIPASQAVNDNKLKKRKY